MEKNSTIDIAQLRVVVDAALRHIEESLGRGRVPLEEDLYWEVPCPANFDLSRQPAELDVGNLRDDLELLNSIFSTPDNATSLTLVHVYPLLKYLAHKVEG